MRILLAEDNQENGTRLQLLLEMDGHDVIRAINGAEAFAKFEEAPFSVVVANLGIPDMDGFELCRQIRTRKTAEYVYVIILVAPGQEFEFLKAEAADVDDVLNFPVEQGIIRARLRVAKRMLDLYGELDRLRGLIPICAYCRKIRQEQGLWEQMEAYISAHSHALFTHTICPECALREFGKTAHPEPQERRSPSRP